MILTTLLSMIYLPIKIDVEDIKEGEVRVEKIDGTVVGRKKFKVSSTFLEIEIPLRERIYNPFIYRVVVKGRRRKILKSLIKVSYFPRVMFDIQSRLQSGVKTPLRITLSPLSLPLITSFDFVVELKDSDGNILWKKKGTIEKEIMEKELIMEVPSVKEELSGSVVLKISNPYFFTEIVKDVSLVPKDIQVFLITDKPIYQPSQIVHIRSLSLYSFNKKSVKNKPFTYKIIDPSSNIVMQRKIETDQFGVGYTSFQLADQVITGTYRIEMYHDKEKVAEKTFQVERYVLPKFNVALKTDKEFYLPSEKVKGEVEVKYFFGKPVDGARVDVKFKKFEIYTEEIGSIHGKTDENGIFKFQFQLPDYFAGMELDRGAAPIFIDVEVEDNTGHIEEKSFDKKVVINPVDIEMVPVGGYLIEGVENKVMVSVSYPDGTPAKGRLLITGKYSSRFSKEIEIPETGFSYFFIKPEHLEDVIVMAHFSSENIDFKKEFVLNTKTRDRDHILLYLKEVRGKVGDNFQIKVLSSRNMRVAYIDIVKESQTYLKKTIKLKEGEGEFNLHVDNLLTGTCYISAYAITSDGHIIRDRKVVYFEPSNELTVTTEHKESYLPGEKAKIVFSVKDREGRPRVSVLGISIVDEAVFALSELHPGLEKVFFQIEKELLKPRYEVHGLRWEIVIRERKREAMDMLLSFISREAEIDFEEPVSYMNHEEIKNSVLEVISPILDRIGEVVENHYWEIDRLPKGEITHFFIEKGFFKREELMDPWGTPLKIKKDFWGNITIVSAGPDEKFQTQDDIEFGVETEVFLFEGGRPLKTVMKARKLMAPQELSAPVQEEYEPVVPADGGEEEKVHVRSYFPETFVFEPALITDSEGRAEMEVRIPDAITTYRMSIFASTPDGLLGSTEDSIKIFKKFFVEPDIPLNFVRGDKVYLRTGVYNYTSKELNVKLKVEGDDKIKIKEKEFNIKIKPQSVEGIYIPLEFVKSGEAKIRITGISSGERDVVEKTITVVPPGIKREISESGELEKEKTFTVSYPETSDPEQREAYLRIYPGALSQILTGLESLLKVPYGCFEQTSSVTYPNILILNYMREKNMDVPEIDMKATQYINLGYQRLLTFEVETGGFSWFGNPPANKVLTAYGLREFTDMKKVFPIDENIIKRTLNWLLSQQENNGSFKPDEYSIDEEVTIGMKKNPLLPTSYIAWTLNEIGFRGEELKKAKSYLKKHIKDLEANYERALFLNAFVGDEDAFNKVWKQLKERMVEDASGIHWESKEGVGLFGKGRTRSIETTALVANALMKMEKEPNVVRKIINYLYRERSPSGDWYTTQATIMALKVITLYSLKAQDVEGRVIVDMGKETKEIKIDRDSREMVVVKIPEGENTVRVKFKGKGSPMYDFVTSFYMKGYPVKKKDVLKIDLKYDKQTLKLNDLVKVDVEVKAIPGVTAEMVIVDLGIPPGFSPVPAEWDELVRQNLIKRYDFTGRQIIVYFERITSEPIKFNYHLRANYPLKVSGAGARIYEYYNPENQAYIPPVPMEVKE